MKQILIGILSIPFALAVFALQLYFVPYAMVSRALSWHPAPKLPTLISRTSKAAALNIRLLIVVKLPAVFFQNFDPFFTANQLID